MEPKTIDDILSNVEPSIRDEFRVYLLTRKSRPGLRRYIKKNESVQRLILDYRQMTGIQSAMSLLSVTEEMLDPDNLDNCGVYDDILKQVILKQVVPDYRSEFIKFCYGLDVSKDFKNYLETDRKAQELMEKAVEHSFDIFKPIQKLIADDRIRREAEMKDALSKIVNEKEWKYWVPLYGFYMRVKKGLPLSLKWDKSREFAHTAYHSVFSFAIPVMALSELFKSYI